MMTRTTQCSRVSREGRRRNFEYLDVFVGVRKEVAMLSFNSGVKSTYMHSNISSYIVAFNWGFYNNVVVAQTGARKMKHIKATITRYDNKMPRAIMIDHRPDHDLFQEDQEKRNGQVWRRIVNLN